MSNGDDESTDEPEPTDTDTQQPVDDQPDATFDDRYADVQSALASLTDDDVEPAAFTTALDQIDGALDAAEAEAELDQIETALDDTENALESAAFPEPEDDEDPAADIESRISTLRDELDDQRGPYPGDIADRVDAVADEIADTRWTETGRIELQTTVASFTESVNDILGTSVTTDQDDLAGSLTQTASVIRDADLHPDTDQSRLQDLIDATDELETGVDDAEAWTDLTTREQLDAQGFYDVLNHRKDYPPELSALKVWEQRGNAEMVLLALDSLGMDFMEEHCLDALKRLGDEAALEPMLERASRRDKPAIEILGKIADPSAIDTIVEYIDTDSDPQLQKVTLKALGEIGSTDTTQAVANKLHSENERIRSHAARSLGLIGDTRAIDPLANVLESDESASVRASAAWALNQIGTRRALESIGEFGDDRSFLVQAEADHALDALDARPA